MEIASLYMITVFWIIEFLYYIVIVLHCCCIVPTNLSWQLTLRVKPLKIGRLTKCQFVLSEWIIFLKYVTPRVSFHSMGVTYAAVLLWAIILVLSYSVSADPICVSNWASSATNVVKSYYGIIITSKTFGLHTFISR